MPPPKKTKTKVRLPGEKKDRIVYQGPKGGFYIKKGGEFVRVKKEMMEGGGFLGNVLDFCIPGRNNINCIAVHEPTANANVPSPSTIKSQPQPQSQPPTVQDTQSKPLQCSTPGGSFGCFINNGKPLVEFLNSNPTITRPKDYIDQLNTKGFKIYYNEAAYMNEVTILKMLIKAGFTLDELNLSPIITINEDNKKTRYIAASFNISAVLTIPDYPTRKLENINIVYFNICGKNLFQTKPREIDYTNFITDIIPTILKLHTKGFVHKDIKPDNILICDNNKYKLIDFGGVCHLSDEKCLREVLMTPGYTLPFILNEAIKLKYYPEEELQSIYKDIDTNTPEDIKGLYINNREAPLPPNINIKSSSLWLRNDWYALSVTILELFIHNIFKTDTDIVQIKKDILFLSNPDTVTNHSVITYFNDRLPEEWRRTTLLNTEKPINISILQNIYYGYGNYLLKYGTIRPYNILDTVNAEGKQEYRLHPDYTASLLHGEDTLFYNVPQRVELYWSIVDASNEYYIKTFGSFKDRLLNGYVNITDKIKIPGQEELNTELEDLYTHIVNTMYLYYTVQCLRMVDKDSRNTYLIAKEYDEITIRRLNTLCTTTDIKEIINIYNDIYSPQILKRPKFNVGDENKAQLYYNKLCTQLISELLKTKPQNYLDKLLSAETTLESFQAYIKPDVQLSSYIDIDKTKDDEFKQMKKNLDTNFSFLITLFNLIKLGKQNTETIKTFLKNILVKRFDTFITIPPQQGGKPTPPTKKN
jgi:serine/threonine protein kinase